MIDIDSKAVETSRVGQFSPPISNPSLPRQHPCRDKYQLTHGVWISSLAYSGSPPSTIERRWRESSVSFEDLYDSIIGLRENLVDLEQVVNWILHGAIYGGDSGR